jgi:hypothetical protein
LTFAHRPGTRSETSTNRPDSWSTATWVLQVWAALLKCDPEVDLMLTALVAWEYVLLVGPPGCGESLLLDAVMGSLGGTTFTGLLTRFTTPEELFGPVSVGGLKEDKYRRVTAGELPEADGCSPDVGSRAPRRSGRGAREASGARPEPGPCGCHHCRKRSPGVVAHLTRCRPGGPGGPSHPRGPPR